MTEQRWIPVSERLPERGAYLVILQFGSTQMVADYDKVLGWVRFDGWFLTSVTHWMPLPAAPERAHDQRCEANEGER